MGEKLTKLNQYISVITNIDEKWFVIFEHTFNHLSFGYVRLPQLEYYISMFASSFLLFFLSFVFFFPCCIFKPLNALYSKFKRLKLSRKTFVQIKSGVPGWGDALQTGPPNFKNFKLIELDGSNFRNG